MDFDLTEEQRLIRDTARDFAAREIAPKAAELDKTGRWPSEIIKQMADLGFLGMAIPEEPVCELMTWACAGWTPSEVDAFAADVLARASLAPRLHREVLRVIAWAKERGAEAFLVSASPRAIIEHAGRAVGFDDAHIIAAVPRYEAGVMIADVERPIPYAAGKVHNLRARIGATRTLVAAFGDNAFDVAMLSQASVPVAVRPKQRLRDRASEVQKLVEIARES